MPSRKGLVSIPASADAKYLGGHVDKARTGTKQATTCAQSASRMGSLLSRVAHQIGEPVAKLVHDKKADPAALYGVASILMSDSNLNKLDTSVTATLASRAHLLPRYARKEISLFESPAL